MPNQKQSSQRIAQLASETLRDPNASGIAKSLAGSAMAQANTGKRTGAEMEDKAARVLNSEKYQRHHKGFCWIGSGAIGKER